MKMIIGATMAVFLAGCASGSAVNPPPAVALTIADGSLAVDSAYGDLERAYLAFAPSLPAQRRSAIKALFHKILACQGTPPVCTGYLKAAHDAKRVGDQTTMAAQITLVSQVIAEIRTLLPQGKAP